MSATRTWLGALAVTTLAVAAPIAVQVTADAASVPTRRAAADVSDAAQLTAALKAAKPGDVITLASGNYDGAFFATTSGTSSQPITLKGPRGAVLQNTKKACDPNVPSGKAVTYCGYGLHLNKASFWRLEGFSIKQAAKGLVLDGSSNTVVDGIEVADIGEEGIHLRAGSSDNVVRNSTVRDTGKTTPGFGEGVYLGSAVSNWPKYGGSDGQDRSNRNQVLNNKIGPNITAEHIDVKEGTVDGLIKGNTFDGAGISNEHFGDSWVDVKGNKYRLEDNVGTGPAALKDGYQTHTQVTGAGCGNEWRNNKSTLKSTGYAINITNQSKCSGSPNKVYKTNTVSGGKGLTNIPLS